MPSIRSTYNLWSSVTTSLFLALFALILPVGIQAQGQETNPSSSSCPANWVALVESTEGQVQASPLDSEDWHDLNVGDCVLEHSQVRILGGRAVLSLPNDSFLRASSDTLIEFSSPAEERSWVSLLKGWLHFLSRTPTEFDVETPYVNAGVKGTEFTVTAETETQTSLIAVLEGNILAHDGTNEVSINGGFEARFQQNQTPTAFRINDTKDVVQWTLHYPPLLVPDTPSFETTKAQLLNNSYMLAANTLETFPEGQRNSDYHSLYSSIDLFRGNVGQAEQHLAAALNQDPNHSLALALRGVILVTKGQLGEAESTVAQSLSNANNGQERASALLAQSYLYQAQFELERSSEVIEQAILNHPNDALLLSRQAELALMLDNYSLANKSSQKAIQLQPTLSHAHSTRGFVLLQGLKFNEAKQAFEEATRLGSSDPLPHLGLGLIAIRKNDLETGRHQLELAAVLDPGHSLVRSYLGKAYFTEDRDKLALTQYDLAEQMDPNDPTPWLYRAILEQNNNRPFAALDALNKSIELNDNRAVYRSRLNLDADEASRMASQGKIYRDLKLNKLSRKIAADSVQESPSNSSGHTLLAQSYINDSRLDEARASEIFQAQVNQPLSTTPILSIFSETNLSVLNSTEPQELGFNEFSNLFNQEKSRAQMFFATGNDNTHVNSLIYSNMYKPFSIAAGYYDYKTNGFKKNAGVEHEVFTVFAQSKISPKWDIQLETIFRKSIVGDIKQTLFPANIFNQSSNRLTDRHFFRANSNYKISEKSSFYSSFSITNSDAKQLDINLITDDSNFPIISEIEADFSTKINTKESTLDFRYDLSLKSISTISGAILGNQNYRANLEANGTITVFPPPPALPIKSDLIFDVPPSIPRDNASKYLRLYSYLYFDIHPSLQLTMGGTHDKIDSFLFEEKKTVFNPKVGIAWKASPLLSIRVASFKGVNLFNLRRQSLEPTLISGSSQALDHIPGTSYKTKSLGLDYSIGNLSLVGVKATRSNSLTPSANITALTKRESRKIELYANLVREPFALSASYKYENIKTSLDLGEGRISVGPPLNIESHKVPITLSLYDNHEGKYLLGVNFVYQNGKYQTEEPGSGFPSTFKIKTKFTTTDFAYKKNMRNNNLLLTISIKNLFNKKFKYEDESYLDPTTSSISYAPRRSLIFNINLNID